jgi:hypothetical protein
LWTASNYLSSRVALLARAISALIRWTTLVPVLHSRAVLRIPLPLASAVRIAASFAAPILARPIGLPLLVPLSREVAAGGVEFAEKADKILQRSAKTVYRPRGNDIDLAAHDLFQKPIELRPFVAAFGAADAFIGEFVGDDPPRSTTNCLTDSLALVVDGLSIFR